MALADILREKKIKAVEGMLLEQDWGKIKNAFPVSSGATRVLFPMCWTFTARKWCCSYPVGTTVTRKGHGRGTGCHAGNRVLERGHSSMRMARNAKLLAEALEKWGYYKPM